MPKNPHADFSPVLKGYSGQSPFKFWCQMALPLTYDDSLSYYELLNKVVSYLNNTISDVANVEDNVGSLLTSFTQLQDYVNAYFDELDIEQELKSILDEMAIDGSLDVLLNPLVVSAVSDWLGDNLTPTTPPVDSTLSIEHAAADAKKTGDEVNNLKNTLDGNNGVGYLATPGRYTNGITLFTADDLAPGNRIWYDFTTTEAAAYISFKNEGGTSIRTIGKTMSASGATSYSGYYDLPSTFSYAIVGTGTNGAVTLNYLYFKQHPKKLLESLSDTKSNLNLSTSGAIYNADEGIQFLSSSFIHGDISDSGAYLEQKYTIMTEEAINITKPTLVCVRNGFRVKPLLYSKTTGAFVSASEWKTTDFYISSYARAYKFVIGRIEANLDTNEVADISDFAKKVFILNVIKQHVTMTRRGRFLDKWSDADEATPRLLSQSATYDSVNDLFYTCGSGNQNADQTINVWDKQTLIKTVHRTDLWHASDITNVDNYLIMATGRNTIPVLDKTDANFATLFTIDASDIAFTVHGVSTNYPSKTVYFVGIDKDDHNRLVIGTLDIANGTATKLFTVARPGGTHQGITAYGNYLYLLYIQSDTIYKLNMDFERITGVFTMDDTSGIFPVGEPETLLKIGSRIALFGACWYRHIEDEMFVTMAQVFDTDIIDKNVYNEKMNYMFPLEKISITVNGEGTTYFNPHDYFNTIEEACYVLNRFGRGIITAHNLAPGDCILVGGNYTIKGAEGTEELSAMTVLNSVVFVVGMNITNLVMEGSVVYMINSTANNVQSDSSALIDLSE